MGRYSKEMQKLIVLLLFSFSVFSLRGQDYYMLVNREGEIPVVDIIHTAENTFDVARMPGVHLSSPSAVLTSAATKEILAAYIKTDGGRSLGMTRSLDGGRSWREEPMGVHWNGERYRSLSMFNLGGSFHGGRHKNAPMRSNLILFSGGNPIGISSSYTNGEHWCNFYPANNFGGFRISGLVRLRDGRHMALFNDDGRFLYHEEGREPELRKSAIYKVYSSDGGLTWSEPQVALKHNLYGLYDAVVTYSPERNDNTLIMIASERETCAAYISFSADNGETWSYPEKLPPFIQGDRFGIAVHHHHLIVAFRDMCRTLNDHSPNPTFGDLVMWSGDLRELVKGNHRSGVKIRIADNYPATTPVDYIDRKFSDCGYVSVLPLSRSEIAFIAYGRWEYEEQPFIRNFVVKANELRQYIKSVW